MESFVETSINMNSGIYKLIRVLCFFLFLPLVVKGGESDGVDIIIRKNSQLKLLEDGRPNSKYIIRGNINLGGRTIAIPQNSILQFDRGVIKNGRIVFVNTKLVGRVNIQSHFSGTVNNDSVFVKWFVKSQSSCKKIQDVTHIVQSIFNLECPKVVFSPGYYQFANVEIPRAVDIEGNNSVILPVALQQKDYDFNFLKNVFKVKDAVSISIKGLHFKGNVTGTIIPNFRSRTIYGEPLIFIDKAQKVVIEHCVFEDIENCTYCNADYTYYGKKQGSCVCLWDVSEAEYINNEQINCRHDEQVLIIAVNKPIEDTKVVYRGNYVHDMVPGPNSSAFTCVTGTCYVENNRVERYSYPGSMFNVFAKEASIKNNTVLDSYCSSVFDVCEYSYFHNDEIIVENNRVEAVNSVMVLGQSEKATIKNNIFRGVGLYYSANNRVLIKAAGGYTYWYSEDGEVLPTDVETIIENNHCDFTFYDGKRSISGSKADYGTGEIIAPQKYNNVGDNYGCGILIHPFDSKAGLIIIRNNTFISLVLLNEENDKNNLGGVFPHSIRLMNTENVEIRGNVFNGCYKIFQNPDEFTCITVYNYPDEMEQLSSPSRLSKKPSDYGNYIIEDNVFNIPTGVKHFYPVVLYARTNTHRQTTLKFNELRVRDNKVVGAEALLGPNHGGTLYKGIGPIKITKTIDR